MVCRRSFVLLPWTTQTLEAGLKTVTNENKTKQNKTETKQQEAHDVVGATIISVGFAVKATGFDPI